MEYTLLDTQFKYGLPSDVDSNGTISIYNIKDKKLNYHIFNKVKPNTIEYDFPIYDPTAPIGFSLFMSKLEKMQINKFVSKNDTAKTPDPDDQFALLNGNNKIDNPNNIPLPRKEHSYCHICHNTFKGYLEHLGTVEHLTTVKWHEKSYKLITDNFQRIRNLWNPQKELESIERIESHIEKLNLSNKSEKYLDIQIEIEEYEENKENINTNNIKITMNTEKPSSSKRKRKKSDYFKEIDLFKDVKKIKNSYNLRNKIIIKKDEINELVDKIGKTKNLLKEDLRLSKY